MKHLHSAVLWSLLLCTSFFAMAEPDSIRLQCEFDKCSNDVYLYTFNGFDFEEVARASRQGEGLFEFQLPISLPRFYYVGLAKDDVKPIILGNERTVRVEGSCAMMRTVRVSGSPLNTKYMQLRGELAKLTRSHNIRIQELSNAYRANNETAASAAIEELKEIDLKKAALLDSLRSEDAFLYAIAALNTMLSYQNNQGRYDNEIEYFGNEFFRFADLSNPSMAGNSMVYEAFRNYASTLSTVGLPADAHLAFIKSSLARTGDNEAVRQLAVGGVLNALERTSHANYKPLAEEFINKYKDAEPAICDQLAQKLVVLKGISIGDEAPDFAQATPAGTELKLSDLRGKVVLIDFWASWCGPCRRENPNVVRLYNQYKDKGFEILGVSLDRDRDRWLQAIEADQLTWQHVSDLNHWSNAAAKMYGVRSIPHTVLVDAEGKVIARNLRGESLARKLEELFGDQAAR